MVGRGHLEADDEHCACLVFSTRYFSFCEINDWHELKGFQQDSFIGTQRMYFVKHRLEKKKILPCNFYSLRKAENFQMIVPFIYIRFELFFSTSLYTIYGSWHITFQMWPACLLERTPKFWFREQSRKEILENPSFL